jgi:hypothetical protein
VLRPLHRSLVQMVMQLKAMPMMVKYGSSQMNYLVDRNSSVVEVEVASIVMTVD